MNTYYYLTTESVTPRHKKLRVFKIENEKLVFVWEDDVFELTGAVAIKLRIQNALSEKEIITINLELAF